MVADYHSLCLLLNSPLTNGAVATPNSWYSVPTTNPILWTFLDAIKLEQGLTDQKFDVSLKLRAPEPRAKEWIEVDQKLEKKMVAYDNDRYEILKFLDVIAATY